MAPSQQKPRRLTELYKDLLKEEKKQQEFAEQKKKFINELSAVQSKLEGLQKEIKNTPDSNQKKKLEQDIAALSKTVALVQNKLTDEAMKIAEIQNKNNLLEGQIKEAKAKLEQHITNAQTSKNKDLLNKAQAAQKDLNSYNTLVKETKDKKEKEEQKKRELAEKAKLEEQKRQEEAMLKAQEKEKKRQEAVRKAENEKVLNEKKAEEKIKSDYIKQRDNLFESAQNICSKTTQITPAVKEILEIDWTKKASEQKMKIAKAAISVVTTGLNNTKSIAKIVKSSVYYVEEAKKIDIADRAKTEGSFFVKLLSDEKTQELLQKTLPQINKVAEEVAPLLVSKTLDYLEKTGKKSEQQDTNTKDFAARKKKIMLQVAWYSGKNQPLPKELQQKFDAIKKEEEAINKANVGAKQSSIRQSLGKTINSLKNRGFDDEYINKTFVPIMSSIIHNASKKPQEVTGAVKAVVDLGLATNSQDQAKAVTKLVLSELVRDTLKDEAVQNLASTQTGFITATIQEIVKNNNSLKDRAEKIGFTDDSIRDLTEMATGVITTGLKFGGKLLEGLSKETEKVEELIEVTINAGKKIAEIIDSNKEIGPEHIIQITNEAKVVANNALELMNQDSVKGVIKELGADIAQDKELPGIIKQGVKTIAKIAAPNVAKLGNFSTVVDFAVDLGLNVTVAGLEGADEVNSLVKNTVLPVALNVASTVVKNRDKIDTLAKQIKNLSEESKKQQVDNPVEKATSAINNGLEVASKITHFLNEGEIRESLTQNLSKLGKDLQSAKYVENLVTTVAQNILPASEIIGDRETANQVIKDSAILAEKTAAAVLSEEKNIEASLDAATAAVATAQSLLSNSQEAEKTAANISKVVEGAVTLLTDKNVATIISNEIPVYIVTHGQTFIQAVTSQLSARQAKKGELAARERLNDDGLAQSLEQDKVQLELSEIESNTKQSSKEKAIEVATTVAKNVTKVLNALQSEEGRKSKEAIVGNLSKLGDQIREQKYIQNIAPKVIEPILQIEALEPLKNSGINQDTINATSIVAEQIIGIALKNADVAIDIASNVAELAQNYAPVVTGKKPANFDDQQQALQGLDSLSHIVEGATKLLTDKEMSRVITGQIPGYIELHGTNIIPVALKLVETFTNKENKENKENKVSSKEKALEIAKDAARGAVNFFNALQSEEGKGSKEAIVTNLSKLGDQIATEHYIQKIVPRIFDSLISIEKQNSSDIQEKSADLMLENQQKPSDTDHHKDPMTPEEAKMTLQDIVETVKSIKDIKNISQFVQDSSAVTEQIISIALKQSDAAINIATSLIALGQDAAQALAKASASSEIKNSDLDDKKIQIVAHDKKLVAAQSNILTNNILTIAKDPAIKVLVTKKLPSYIQGNKDTILAITKQLTGQYHGQIEAIGLSDEVIKQTAELSVKLLTDENIVPIYELVGNIVNNAEMSNSGKQSDIALLINHIYNAALNKDNKDARKEPVQNAINKIGDIIFSANTHDQVKAVVTQNIPTLLRENEKAIAGLAEEFLERTDLGQNISSRISIDVERALKVAEEKSGTFLSLLENYHKKNYLGAVKNVIDLATSPKVIKFLGSTAARTIHMKIKGSHADRVNKRRPVQNERGR